MSFPNDVRKVCIRDECNKTQMAKGLCRQHYGADYSNTSDGVLGKDKLTPEQIVEAKRMWSQFKSNKEIAAHFGVAIPTVRRALKHEP